MSKASLDYCIFPIRNYKENIIKYMPQLSSLDAFREKSSRVCRIDHAIFCSALRFES